MSGLDNGLYHRLDIIRFIPSMWGGGGEKKDDKLGDGILKMFFFGEPIWEEQKKKVLNIKKNE
ncbi:hypothetical protein, partial [Salmonella enterica]